LDLCNALMWYVKSAKRSAKMRGIQLLIRVIQDLPNASLEIQEKALTLLNKLMMLRDNINNRYKVEQEKQEGMFSNYFQSLVELVCVTRLAISSINTQVKKNMERKTQESIKGK